MSVFSVEVDSEGREADLFDICSVNATLASLDKETDTLLEHITL